jgi:hypothetical protein
MNHDLYMNIQEEKSNEIRLNIERLNTIVSDQNVDADQDVAVDGDGNVVADADAIEELYQSVIVDSLYDSLAAEPMTGSTIQPVKGGKGSQSMKGKRKEPLREGRQIPANEVVREEGGPPTGREMMDTLRSLGWDLSLPTPRWMRERIDSINEPTSHSYYNNSNNNNNNNGRININNTENSINMDIGITSHQQAVEKQPKPPKQSKQPEYQQPHTLLKQMSEKIESITSPKRKFSDLGQESDGLRSGNIRYEDDIEISSSTVSMSSSLVSATHSTIAPSTIHSTMPITIPASSVSTNTHNNDSHDIDTFLDVILLCQANQSAPSDESGSNEIRRNHENGHNNNNNISSESKTDVDDEYLQTFRNNNNNSDTNINYNNNNNNNPRPSSRPAPAPLKASKTAGRSTYL